MKVLSMALVALLCLQLCGIAQMNSLVKPLTVGDILPVGNINGLKNYTTASTTIPGMHKKLIILDFWATWCSSCIALFPKMHSLQKQFDNELQIVLVNVAATDSPEKIAALFKKQELRFGTKVTLPYTLQDETIQRYFPFQTVPHYIWLDSLGKVLAITGQQKITAHNISAMLDGRSLPMEIKTDSVSAQLKNSSLDQLAQLLGTATLYRSTLTEAIPGVNAPGGNSFTETGLITRVFAVNHELKVLFAMAFPDTLNLPLNRVFISPAIADSFYVGGNHDDPRRYSYELLTPPLKPELATLQMRYDLERYFRITVRRADSLLPCITLVSLGRHKKLLPGSGVPAVDTDERSLKKFIHNRPISDLLSALYRVLDKTTFDETGISQNISIDLPSNFYKLDIKGLNKFLASYGLGVKEQQRLLSIAVFVPITH